jgi:hypothetical protein
MTYFASSDSLTPSITTLAEWLAAAQCEPRTEADIFAQGALLRSLDLAMVRSCSDEGTLVAFLDFIKGADRGARLNTAASLARHLTRGRIASLVNTADDQLNRLYLASPEMSDQFSREFGDILAAVRSGEYQIAS